MSELPTTKICPNCQLSAMALLRSYNMKVCSACHHKVVWKCAPGQQPLVANNRAGKIKGK